MSPTDPLRLPPAQPFTETAPAAEGAPSARTPQANSPSALQPAPQPTRLPVPAWFRASLARPAEFVRTHRFEFSTALFQHSAHGRSTGPEHHAEGERRYPPAHSAALSRGAAGPRPLTDLRLPAASAAPRVTALPRETRTSQEDVALLDAIATPTHLAAHVAQHVCGNVDAVVSLASRLHALCRPQAASDAQAAMRGALLAQALAQAAQAVQPGTPEADAAHRTLERVGMLDFAAPHRQRSSSAAERDAWRVARLLARSGEGRAVLATLRSATLNAYDDDLQRMGVEVLLTSAEALEPLTANGTPAPGGVDPAPGALAERLGLDSAAPLASDEAGPSALARRAFDAAAALLEHGRDALTPDQRGALFAWRQAFADDGRHTVFSQTRTRLARFSGKTIPRVAERRWKTLLPRMLRGKHGSPLRALRLGTQGVPRKTIADERAKVREHLHAALPELMASPAMQPRAALAHARPAQSLAELAALHIWLERGGFAPGRLDAATLRAIAERAHALNETAAQAGTALPAQHAQTRETIAGWLALPPEALEKTKPFRSLAKRPFTVDRLAAWGKVAGLPADAPFWTTVDALRATARHEPAARAVESVDDARETLLDVVSNLQSGQRLRLTDGGRQGISTRGLNMTLQMLLHAHAVLVSPRADLRAARTREAVVDISRSTHGVDLFVGTARTSMHSVGAGLFAGYDIATSLATVRVGAVASVVLDARELSAPRGVTLRVARRMRADGSGYDDEAMRAKLADVVAHLFDESAGAHDDGANGVWNRLAARYWDDPDISISWTDGHAASRRRGVTLDANATVKVASFGGETRTDPVTGEHAQAMSARVGPSVGAGWERTRQHAESLDHSGRLRIEEQRVGAGSHFVLRAAVAPGFSHALDADGHRSLGLFSVDAPAATLALRERNRSAKLKLVREDGRLSHRGCLLDIEYLDARSYTRAVDEARADLIALFAAGFAQASGASPQTRAAERIDAHLAAVRKNQRPNLTYVQRYRLRRTAAQRMDANEAMLAQSGGDAALAQSVAKANARILDDPASWMAVELKVKERTSSARSFGPNFIVQLTTRMGAVGDREIVTEGVPFAVLEALDR